LKATPRKGVAFRKRLRRYLAYYTRLRPSDATLNRAAVIQAAYFAVIAMGDEPSQRSLQAMTKRICGKALQTSDVLDFLRSKRSSSTSVANEHMHPVAEVKHELATSGSVPVAALSSPHAGVVKVLELETHTTANAVSARTRVAPVRLHDDFGDLENDVTSVIANDAAERRDGKISANVLDGLRQRLARARDRYGVDAFSAGLEIALDRSKGAAYATGCMKRWQPNAEGPRGSPGLFQREPVYPGHEPPAPYFGHLEEMEQNARATT
jgi:hypothetical protein